MIHYRFLAAQNLRHIQPLLEDTQDMVLNPERRLVQWFPIHRAWTLVGSAYLKPQPLPVGVALLRSSAEIIRQSYGLPSRLIPALELRIVPQPRHF